MKRKGYITWVFLLGMLAAALGVAHVYHTRIKTKLVRIEVVYQTHKKELLTVYWDSGDGWNGRDMSSVKVRPGRENYVFELPVSGKLLRLRIDPDGKCDSVFMGPVHITGLKQEFRVGGLDSLPQNGMKVTALGSKVRFIRNPENTDPFFVLTLPTAVQEIPSKISGTDLAFLLLFLLIPACIVWMLWRHTRAQRFLMTVPLPKLLLLTLFLALLVLPFWNTLFPFFRKDLNVENRKLAECPKGELLFSGAGSYVKALDLWLTDRFDFRNELVRSNSIFRYEVFRTPSLRNKVLIGSESQLFPVNQLLQDDCLGKAKFTDFELLILKQNLLLKISYFNSKGIPYLLVIPPSKQTFCPEYLPRYYRDFRSDKGLLKQFLDYLGPDLDHYLVVLYDSMKAHSVQQGGADWFYRYDMHWNELGAFDAYQTVMDRITTVIPEAGPALRKSDVRITTEYDNQADMARNLLLNDILLREKYVITPIRPRPLSLNPVYGQFRFPALEYKNPLGKKTALFYRDSYTDQWKELFAYNFENTYYIWDQHISRKHIERYKPDIVIQELSEMFLHDLFIPLDDTTTRTTNGL